MTCVCINIKRGDRIVLVASGHGKFANIDIEQLVNKFGKGPHLVTGVGPTCVGVELGTSSVNIPKTWTKQV